MKNIRFSIIAVTLILTSTPANAECERCERQPTLGEYFQCQKNDPNNNMQSIRNYYRYCKIERLSPDRQGYIHNKCKNMYQCNSLYAQINGKMFYRLNKSGECSRATQV